MAHTFPSTALYALIIYLFVASGASMWLCLYFHDEIHASNTNTQMWFFLSIFLSNNIFAVIAAFMYWVKMEKQEAADVIAAHSCPCSGESAAEKPYGKLVQYFDNQNYLSEEENPSLI